MSYNFAGALVDAARISPSQVHVITEGGEGLTFAQVERCSARAAAAMASRGVGLGSRVGIRLPNSVEFLAAYFGALSLGAVVFPLGTATSSAEVQFVVDDGDLSAVVVDSDHSLDVDDVELWLSSDLDAKAVQELAPVPIDHGVPAVVVYTSGSTGRPKGVQLTHLNLLLTPLLAASTTQPMAGEVAYAVLPFFHVYGLSDLVNTSVVRRTTLVLRNRFSTEALFHDVERYAVTYLPGVPTMFHAAVMADSRGRDLSSIRTVCSGGAPITPQQVTRIGEVFPAAHYTEGYGLTETGALGTYNGHPFEFRHGSVGRAIQGVSIRVVDTDGQPMAPGAANVGEIVISGPVVMAGYLDRSEETACALRDGWLHTGDLGWLDEDGFLFLAGRSNDLIISSGYNVHPREVEAALERHPEVAAAAVVGRPHEHLGEEIVAFVVPTVMGLDDLAARLGAHDATGLSPYKRPREVIITEQLPLGPTGKIDKLALRDRAVVKGGST